MINGEIELQIVSTESKSIEIDFDFAEKLKIEVGRNFQTRKSRSTSMIFDSMEIIWNSPS